MSEGDNARKRDNLSGDTLLGYVTAAATWLRVIYGIAPPLYENSNTSATPRLVPFIAEIVRQRSTWREPSKKKEPYTGDMLDALGRNINGATARDASTVLDKEAAVFDWVRLGVFTGSRLSEYAQGKRHKGQMFATIPDDAAAGSWRGQAIAFIQSDFTFLDFDRRHVPFEEAIASGATELHVRFRFDKSKENFTVRKFKRNHGHYLCPVKAALSIIRRARLLRVPQAYPLGVFRTADSSTYSFLSAREITFVMRAACTQAYPDPMHHMRLNIHRIVSHSNRVTAAVALHNAGVSIEDISFRLRWNSDAVKFYLRDCFKSIGTFTSQALAGAYLI